ncbi:7270_t:CDS:2 [Entrophospora sp. SA101]|nr:7270_t:CDS:2 [Entrophospora sp. SA101]
MSVATNTNLTIEDIKKWKRVDVPEYLRSKQDEYDLDDEDIKIIERNKVAGKVFLNLTEEKLIALPYNLMGGPAGAIALLIKILYNEEQNMWNRDYNEWPDLKNFSAHFYDIGKEQIHFTYKREIDSLRTLFPKDHPAQLKLTIMEDQLKLRACWRGASSNTDRPVRSNLADFRFGILSGGDNIRKATKVTTKQKMTEKKKEIAKNSVIMNGYYRINDHYNQYHKAHTLLLKRGLSADDERTGTKKVKPNTEADRTLEKLSFVLCTNIYQKWIRCLENVRKEANLAYNITEIINVQQLQEELVSFRVPLKRVVGLIKYNSSQPQNNRPNSK